MKNSYVEFIESIHEFDFKELLKSYTKVFVFADKNTCQYCYPFIKNILPLHFLEIIEPGEEQKTLQTCVQLWQSMTNEALDRKAIVINLGGGVLGDMGGFCAATYKRGIDFIQIPTTLLSQVDASVGGKLGIDFDGFKNHIGVFQEPQKVIIYPGFLQTLPKRELRSGYAEVIKHALIKEKFHWNKINIITLENLYNFQFDVTDIIKHSIQIKSDVVEADPTEKGLRKILNFGHTLGHAIESFYLPMADKKLLHGEAIAIGMITESYLSFVQKLISESELNAISSYILSIYGKINISEAEIEQIIPLTLHDKKNSHGAVNFSLIQNIGNCVFDIKLSTIDMFDALKYYQKL